MLGDYIYWCCIGVGAVAALATIALLRAFVCSFDRIDQSVSFMCPFYHIYQSVSLWCCSGSFPLSLSLSLLMCCSSFGNVFVGVLSTVFIYPSLYCVNLIFYSLSLSLSLSLSPFSFYISILFLFVFFSFLLLRQSCCCDLVFVRLVLRAGSFPLSLRLVLRSTVSIYPSLYFAVPDLFLSLYFLFFVRRTGTFCLS